MHQVVHLSPYNPCQVCKSPEIQSSKPPKMNSMIFNLRLKRTNGGFNWDEIRSLRVHESKIKKIPWVEKFSAPPKDDPLKLGFFDAWLS